MCLCMCVCIHAYMCICVRWHMFRGQRTTFRCQFSPSGMSFRALTQAFQISSKCFLCLLSLLSDPYLDFLRQESLSPQKLTVI